MNIWTDIAIGNLQRRRGPPLDIDLDPDESEKLYKCKGPCGQSKPADEFYLKHDNRTGTHRRQSTCKACVCAREVARRPKNPRKPRPYQAVLDLLESGPKTLREIYEAMGVSRRLAQRMIYNLIDDGRVFKNGRSGVNRDPQNPPIYQKTTAPVDPAERITAS